MLVADVLCHVTLQLELLRTMWTLKREVIRMVKQMVVPQSVRIIKSLVANFADQGFIIMDRSQDSVMFRPNEYNLCNFDFNLHSSTYYFIKS